MKRTDHHWHGIDPEHKKGSAPGVEGQQSESDAVKAWEARIAKARANSRAVLEGDVKKTS